MPTSRVRRPLRGLSPRLHEGRVSGPQRQPATRHARLPARRTSAAGSTSSASFARVYERYGFEPLETPAFENIETLLGKYGEEGNKLIFKILQPRRARGERARPISRCATTSPSRSPASSPSTRTSCRGSSSATRFSPSGAPIGPRAGGFASSISATSTRSDRRRRSSRPSCSRAVSEVLDQLGFNDFKIRLNHRRVLDGLLEVAGIAAGRHGDGAHRAGQARQDWRGGCRSGIRGPRHRRRRPPPGSWRCFGDFVTPPDVPSLAGVVVSLARLRPVASLAGFDALCRRRRGVDRDPRARAATRRLPDTCRVDPSLARGLSYYTGAIMEIAVPDLAGSLGGGGRYDNLIGMFLGREVPACGFSLGLERIIVVMTRAEHVPVCGGDSAPLTSWWRCGTTRPVATRWCWLPSCAPPGLRVDVYPESGATRQTVQVRVRARGAVRGASWARMSARVARWQSRICVSGQQQSVPRAAVAAFIARRVNPER